MTDQTKFTSKLQGKNILVIGGSSGIGFAVAEASLEAGATVTISSSNPTRIQNSLKSLSASYPTAASSGRIHGSACDIGNEATIESNLSALLSEATANNTKKLHHIVWTAGDSLAVKKVSELDVATIQRAGIARFVAPLLLAKLAPGFLVPGPEASVTLTTGAVSERPMKDWTLVNSYATGLQGMVRGLALDLAPVRFNLVSPGAVDTALWSSMGMDDATKKGMFAAIEAGLPTGKVGTAEDVAESYLYFMRDHNVTGSMVSTNGGTLLASPGYGS